MLRNFQHLQHLPGENLLICSVFQIALFKMKLKLWQTQVMAKSFMHLSKHSPVNSQKYAALFSIMLKEFENKILN